MNEIVQLVLYIIGVTMALLALWFVDFNRFIRVGKKEYAIFVYVILAIALGLAIGKFFIEIGTLFKNLVAS